MKKYIFILLVFLTSTVFAAEKNTLGSMIVKDSKDMVSTLYNDGKTAVTAVYEDGKTAISELYPDVKSAVVNIAQGIGVAAEHVYSVLVKKFFVLGIKELLIFIFSLILFIIGLVWIIKIINGNKFITWKQIPPICIMAISFAIGFEVDYETMLMGLMNPEFGAINYILEYAKGIV